MSLPAIQRTTLRRAATFLRESAAALRESSTVNGRWPADALSEQTEYNELRELARALTHLAQPRSGEVRNRHLTLAQWDKAEFIGVYRYPKRPNQRIPIRRFEGHHFNLLGDEVDLTKMIAVEGAYWPVHSDTKP